MRTTPLRRAPHPRGVAVGHKQRGTVLITVIMMVAIAAVIVTDMSYRQKMDIKRTSALLSRDQAYQYLLGAEEIANWSLVRDLKDDHDGSDPVIADTLGEPWAQPPQPFPVAGGFIQGRITDLQGRFNVNSLLASDPKVAQKQRDRLRMLMDLVGIPSASDTDVTTPMLVERLVDWLDANQEPTGFDGREDLDYLTEDPPYRAANRVLWDLSELMLVAGFTADVIALLADYVSFLPPDTPLNVNTASALVLDAYQLGIPGAQIVEAREQEDPGNLDGGFRDMKAFNDLLLRVAAQTGGQPQNVTADATNPSGEPPALTAQDAANRARGNPQTPVGNFTVSSEFFELAAEAVINQKPVLMRAVLYRPELEDQADNRNNKQRFTIKTLARKLEDPLKRV